MGKSSQEKLFVKIHKEYKNHYYDQESIKYRDNFIYKYMYESENLNEKDIAEIACGSGYNSLAILKIFPKANLNGYDISPPACNDYQKIVGNNAFIWDITKEKVNDFKYDFVIVIGGLHHCINNLDKVIENIHNMLKKNGTLIMVEPNKNYALNFIRKIWYKFDNYFDNENEDSLDHSLIINQYKDKFEFKKIRYFGGPAYFFILQSLILRMPIVIKPLFSKLLFWIERIYNKFQYYWIYPAFIAKWKKK